MISAAGGDGGGVKGEAAMDYEVLLQSGEHEEYPVLTSASLIQKGNTYNLQTSICVLLYSVSMHAHILT